MALNFGPTLQNAGSKDARFGKYTTLPSQIKVLKYAHKPILFIPTISSGTVNIHLNTSADHPVQQQAIFNLPIILVTMLDLDGHIHNDLILVETTFRFGIL